MFLRSLIEHKKQTSVLVNGHTYFIGQDLVVRDQKTNQPIDIPEIDASKLLQNYRAWKEWKQIDAPVPSKPVVIETPKEEIKAAPIEAPKEEVVENQDPPIPEKGQEWPDPKETHSLEWLKACAKAYKVNLGKAKDKAVIVKKLMSAMYE